MMNEEIKTPKPSMASCVCGKLTAIHSIEQVQQSVFVSVYEVKTGRLYMHYTSLVCADCGSPCWTRELKPKT